MMAMCYAAARRGGGSQASSGRDSHLSRKMRLACHRAGFILAPVANKCVRSSALHVPVMRIITPPRQPNRPASPRQSSRHFLASSGGGERRMSPMPSMADFIAPFSRVARGFAIRHFVADSMMSRFHLREAATPSATRQASWPVHAAIMVAAYIGSANRRVATSTRQQAGLEESASATMQSYRLLS